MKSTIRSNEESNADPVRATATALSEGTRVYRLLTSRERDVVASLSTGDTDREIAARLGLSPRTVHKHLEHVYQKLGVATRTAAVMRVIGQLAEPRH